MKSYIFFRRFFRWFFSVFFRWQVAGTEHIPKEGPVILCANHISNWDPPLLGAPLERKVHFMAKEELFRVPILSYFITLFGAYPVRRGAGDRAAIRATLEILQNGHVVGMFPEGSRSKTGQLKPGQPGVALFALKSDAQVVPAAIIGPYRLFRPVKVIYGKPLDLSRFKQGKPDSGTLREATDFIMQHIQQLIEANKS
ncbi:lysophospholipid acyltransferase family protein [Brevibacillus marinus]|uniref:lysophospholipid acyltransferase family protein n=1 Tax=Brevibacillus marinus TaxID=2496837 RepID=UPI000F830682|nr:lysophospholipid acyltransferase family protein [Brevibacillus marinus]